MEENSYLKEFSRTVIITIAVIVLGLLTISLTGCKSVEYVPVETVKHDTVSNIVTKRDSIFLRDSIFVNQYTKGDTVFRDRLKWRTEYIERTKHDSVYISIVDSIPVPYPEIVEVEKKLSFWQKALMVEGVIFMFGLLFFFATLGYCMLEARKNDQEE